MVQIYKSILAFALFMVFLNWGYSITLDIQQDYHFHYYLEDVAGDYVTGQTINIKIIRGSDLFVLDHNDDTFKNSGWTNKVIALTDNNTEEVYHYTFNPPASETGAETYDLQIDNSDSLYGVHIGETINYAVIGNQDSGGDVNVTTIESIDATDAITTSATASLNSYDSPTEAEMDAAFLVIRGGDSDTLETLSDQLDSASTHSAADVWTSGTRTITGLTAAALADFFDTDSGTTSGSAIAGSVVKEIVDNAGGGGLTNASIADAVWDELQAGHTTADTFGKFLDSEVSAAGGGGLTNASIADAVLEELIADHSGTSGSLAEFISDIGDATDGDRESSVWTGIELLITAGI